MSMFRAINMAFANLYSRSIALGNTSENTIDARTTGFKDVDMRFADYQTVGTQTDHEFSSVVGALPHFFAVSRAIGYPDGGPAGRMCGQQRCRKRCGRLAWGARRRYRDRTFELGSHAQSLVVEREGGHHSEHHAAGSLPTRRLRARSHR
jgi:hypothetical protein